MGRQNLVNAMMVLTLLAALVSTGCSTRKFTRNQLQALDSNLSARLDTEDKSIAKLGNDAREISERLDTVDKKTNDNASQITTVKSDVAKVDGKATEAGNSARNAQAGADRANTGVASLEKTFASLETKFRDRNDYELAGEKQILFKFSSSKLGEDFDVPLSDLAKQLKDNPDMFVVLEGHTDSVGDAAYNIQLAEKRNDAVMRYLIVNQGVPPYKVFQASFGEDQPIAENNSKEGREKNRSVVLQLYRAKSSAATVR